MKTYTYKNQKTGEELSFTSKPVNLELRKNSLQLINKFKEFAEPYTRKSVKMLEAAPAPTEAPDPNAYKNKTKNQKYISDKLRYNLDKAAFDKAFNAYQNEMGVAMSIFLLEEDNLRETFTQFLDGDIDKIDYSGETEESTLELLSLGMTILSDFFEVSRSLIYVAKK